MSEDSPINEIDPDRFPKLLQWCRDTSNSDQLKLFMASPVGTLLIDVLREAAIPEQTVPNLGAAETDQLMHKLAFMQLLQSGQNLTVENLLALRHPVVAPEQDSLGEWTGGIRVENQMEAQKEV